jgi:hypothetical protein
VFVPGFTTGRSGESALLELGETPSAKSAAGASKEAPANSPIVANRRRETPLILFAS